MTQEEVFGQEKVFSETKNVFLKKCRKIKNAKDLCIGDEERKKWFEFFSFPVTTSQRKNKCSIYVHVQITFLSTYLKDELYKIASGKATYWRGNGG